MFERIDAVGDQAYDRDYQGSFCNMQTAFVSKYLMPETAFVAG